MVFTETPPQTSTSATVLVIDDEDLHYWSDTVRNFPSNYTVLRAHDCKSGLAICRDRAVDCVLLDIDMPESGFFALCGYQGSRSLKIRLRQAFVMLIRCQHHAVQRTTADVPTRGVGNLNAAFSFTHHHLGSHS